MVTSTIVMPLLHQSKYTMFVYGNVIMRTEEMVQWVKHLPHKCEGLSSSLQNPLKARLGSICL